MNNCKHCGSMFVSSNSRREYCSVACGNTFRRLVYEARLKDKSNPGKFKANGSLQARNILSRVKFRAKEYGLDFNLDIEDIIIPSNCPVLGMPLVMQVGKGRGLHPDSPSLDRINPKLGYVKGNVRIISSRANLLKNNATVAELASVLDDLRKLHETPTPG